MSKHETALQKHWGDQPSGYGRKTVRQFVADLRAYVRLNDWEMLAFQLSHASPELISKMKNYAPELPRKGSLADWDARTSPKRLVRW